MSRKQTKKLLLFSSLWVQKSAYPKLAREVRAFLGPVEQVLFIPYARHDYKAYTKNIRRLFRLLGYKLDSLSEASDPQKSIDRAETIFVGGGNTFRLLKTLQEKELLYHIRRRVLSGVPYIGSSAGSNIACPTIKTTNDMPITSPFSLKALSLIPFQINPHFLDPHKVSDHHGETREQRIEEFHEINSVPVLGLREGAWVAVENDRATLRGKNGARLFRRNQRPKEYKTGASLSFLLKRK